MIKRDSRKQQERMWSKGHGAVLWNGHALSTLNCSFDLFLKQRNKKQTNKSFRVMQHPILLASAPANGSIMRDDQRTNTPGLTEYSIPS